MFNRRKILDTSENDCIKATKELMNSKKQIQNILKLTEIIKTETNKMIETDNYTYKKDVKIEQFIEMFNKNNELNEMKVLSKIIHDNFEEMTN